MVMRVASFFPFQTTYYLNGHSFIDQELKRAQIGFRKTDNAFLAADDGAALQAAADRLSPVIIRGRLDYWTLILGPKFSTKERSRRGADACDEGMRVIAAPERDVKCARDDAIGRERSLAGQQPRILDALDARADVLGPQPKADIRAFDPLLVKRRHRFSSNDLAA